MTETKRLIPAVEQQPAGVHGQTGMSTGVTMGITRRLAVYTLAVGTHVFRIEEELKGKSKPAAFEPGASIQFATDGSRRAWIRDPDGKERKARLADDTFDAPGPPRKSPPRP